MIFPVVQSVLKEGSIINVLRGGIYVYESGCSHTHTHTHTHTPSHTCTYTYTHTYRYSDENKEYFKVYPYLRVLLCYLYVPLFAFANGSCSALWKPSLHHVYYTFTCQYIIKFTIGEWGKRHVCVYVWVWTVMNSTRNQMRIFIALVQISSHFVVHFVVLLRSQNFKMKMSQGE